MTELQVQRSLLDDIRDFIEEKWKHSACELCDTDSWMVYPAPTTHVFLTVGSESGPPRVFPQPMVAFLPVSCINCGNLRLIDARTLERWRRERDRGNPTSPS
jgi:hypothetical protein